jgi:hypothetical protein
MNLRSRKTCPPRQRAFMLIAVLVSLTLVMMLFAAWIKTVARAGEQLRAQQYRLQAEYLVDSALGRAAAQLAANPRYTGETWRPTVHGAGADRTGNVTIEIVAAPEPAARRLLRVVADYPEHGIDRARRSKEIQIGPAAEDQKP